MDINIKHKEMSARETIAKLIRAEFDSTEWWNYQKTNELIATARTYELNTLADEMEHDL